MPHPGELVFPNDALVADSLALDVVLGHMVRFREQAIDLGQLASKVFLTLTGENLTASPTANL